MKPIYFKKYQKQVERSFLVRYAEVPHTYDKFHYHDEYELIYHIENRGTRFVGDSIQRFDHGDLVLIGPKIPHYWHSDDVYFENTDLKAKLVLVQFKKDFLGQHFFDVPEMSVIKGLFERASQAIHFTQSATMVEALKALPLKNNWEQLLSLLQILCELGTTEHYKLLTSKGFSNSSFRKTEDKVSIIFSYILKNYHREIPLDEISDHANMNKSAFCRFLKNATNKTFSQVLNEIRVGFACKEIIYSDKTIGEIAYGCGYANTTYFNKVFKELKSRTPNDYRKLHGQDRNKIIVK